jgi:hypothetical protein
MGKLAFVACVTFGFAGCTAADWNSGYNPYAINPSGYYATPTYPAQVPIQQPTTQVPAAVYPGAESGHWIRENISSGSYIELEDGSLWQIEPYDKFDTSLWLPVTSITVVIAPSMPGYDYLLINTDDKEGAHARYVGR